VRIRVLFFGVLRDIVGLREDSIEVPEGGRLEAVFEHYATQFPRIREMSKSLVLALNQRFSEPGAPLSEGDEVAILPPVSGGSGSFTHEIADPAGHFFALTRDPIDGVALARRLQRDEDGAVTTFEGVTRNNTKGRATRYLEYECYEAMAVKTMAQIATGVRDIWRPYVDVIFAAAGASPSRSGRNEVRLVLTDRMLGALKSEALGWVAFVDGRPSQTIANALRPAVRDGRVTVVERGWYEAS